MNASLLDQGLWIALSVGIAILAGVLLAYVELMYQRAPLQQKWWYIVRNHWFADSLRLLYATSIPAVALFAQGILTYRGLGLKAFPWSLPVSDQQKLWMAWQYDIEKALIATAVTGIILFAGVRSGEDNDKYRKPGLLASAFFSIQESIIDQIHWAFYRELCITFWGIPRGSWIVAVPILLELLLNPATWTRLKTQNGIISLGITSGIFIASTILFMQTQNLWLMMTMEFTLRMLFAKVFEVSKRL